LDPTALQRALESAPERATIIESRPEREFFLFRLGELRLGVPSENVREVLRPGLLTPLPKAPAFVLGVCGHRGEVLPVIDLLRYLGKGEAKVGLRTRLFVGMAGNYIAGVVADSVIGLRRIQVSEILPIPTSGDASTEHLLGVVRPANSDEAVTLINFPKLLHAARQRAVTR
jgi:purine-binding chemotaxis protein CheW